MATSESSSLIQFISIISFHHYFYIFPYRIGKRDDLSAVNNNLVVSSEETDRLVNSMYFIIMMMMSVYFLNCISRHDSTLKIQLYTVSQELNQCKELLRVQYGLNNKYKKEVN